MINELVYIILRMVISITTYTMIYTLLLNYKLQVSMKFVVCCCAISFFIQCFLGLFISGHVTIWTIDILCLVIPAFWFGRPHNRNIIMHIYILISCSIINYFGYFLVVFLLLRQQINVELPTWLNAESNFTTLIFILLYFALYGRKHREYQEVYFTKVQAFVFFIGLILCGIIIGGIEIIQQDDIVMEIDKAFLCLLVSALSVIFILFGIWYGLLLRKQIVYEVQNEQYESFLRKQEQYMKLIENQDEKLRMFRHDMRAHITAMETFIREHDTDELSKYLVQIKSNSRIYQNKRYTGCTVVDAIIDQYIHECKNNNTKFEWEGQLPEQFSIQIYDLCILFSNIISNAVEATKKMENGIIKLRIYTYNNNVYINLKNTYDGKIHTYNDTFISTKADANQHGIGMKNIRNIVHKYDGSIKINYDERWFDLEIVV